MSWLNITVRLHSSYKHPLVRTPHFHKTIKYKMRDPSLHGEMQFFGHRSLTIIITIQIATSIPSFEMTIWILFNLTTFWVSNLLTHLSIDTMLLVKSSLADSKGFALSHLVLYALERTPFNCRTTLSLEAIAFIHSGALSRKLHERPDWKNWNKKSFFLKFSS